MTDERVTITRKQWDKLVGNCQAALNHGPTSHPLYFSHLIAASKEPEKRERVEWWIGAEQIGPPKYAEFKAVLRREPLGDYGEIKVVEVFEGDRVLSREEVSEAFNSILQGTSFDPHRFNRFLQALGFEP